MGATLLSKGKLSMKYKPKTNSLAFMTSKVSYYYPTKDTLLRLKEILSSDNLTCADRTFMAHRLRDETVASLSSDMKTAVATTWMRYRRKGRSAPLLTHTTIMTT